MGPDIELRSNLIRYLRDVQKDHPSKIVKGSELMDYFSITEDVLRFYLRLYFDLKYIELLSDKVDQSALIRITKKGFQKFED